MNEKTDLNIKWELLDEYHNTTEKIKYDSKKHVAPIKNKTEEHNFAYSWLVYLMVVSILNTKENGKSNKHVDVSVYDVSTGSDEPIFTYSDKEENYREPLEKFLKNYHKKYGKNKNEK